MPTNFLEYKTNLESTAATLSGWELISVLCRACAAGLFGLSFSLIGSCSFLWWKVSSELNAQQTLDMCYMYLSTENMQIRWVCEFLPKAWYHFHIKRSWISKRNNFGDEGWRWGWFQTFVQLIESSCHYQMHPIWTH